MKGAICEYPQHSPCSYLKKSPSIFFFILTQVEFRKAIFIHICGYRTTTAKTLIMNCKYFRLAKLQLPIQMQLSEEQNIFSGIFLQLFKCT